MFSVAIAPHKDDLMRSLLIATVKNEGPFLLEWVAWHRLIGFDDIIIAQNDSDDMTAEILQGLAAIGAIHFVENTVAPDSSKPMGSHQMRAYRRASNLPVYAQADWAMTLDADEFLVITTGQGRVADLIAELGADNDQILVHWSHIGSNGESTFKDDLVTSRFFETYPADRATRIKTCVKTLFRPGAFQTVGIHFPQPAVRDASRTVTASGHRLPDTDMGKDISMDPGGQTLAQLFHYQIRDAESFTLAKMRGRANPGTTYVESLGYWVSGDPHDRETDLLTRERGRILAEIDRLDRMSGGQLRRLHLAAVAASQARIAAFKTDPVYAEFYASICRLQSRIRGPERRQALMELYQQGEISWNPG